MIVAPADSKQTRTEPDAEPFDLDVAPLGDDEMPQLMNEDHHSQPEGDRVLPA